MDSDIRIWPPCAGRRDPLAPLTAENRQTSKIGKASRGRQKTSVLNLQYDRVSPVKQTITTASLSHGPDEDSSTEQPPELVSSSEDGDMM
jgi:hypothetical protein